MKRPRMIGAEIRHAVHLPQLRIAGLRAAMRPELIRA